MLFETIKSDMVVAQKAQDARRLSLLRMLVSALKYKQIDSGKENLTDEEVVAVLRTEAKKRKESMEIFEKAGDAVRSEQERYELAEIEKYLPQLMSEDEVRLEVDRTARETGNRGGRLIGMVMGKLRGRADGQMVERLVNERYRI